MKQGLSTGKVLALREFLPAAFKNQLFTEWTFPPSMGMAIVALRWSPARGLFE